MYEKFFQSVCLVRTQALPFRISAGEAVEHFKTWALHNTPVFIAPRAESIRAVYLPFWVFQCTTTVERLHPVPGFAQTSDCIQEWIVYAGQDVPRSHLDVWLVPRITSVQFSPALLTGPGDGLTPHIEERKTFETTAFRIAKEMIEKREKSMTPNTALHIKLEGVTSHQLLFPGYVIEYCEFGTQFQCLVSGVNGAAFGVQQTVFPSKQFGAFVQRINSYRLKSFGSDARMGMRAFRLARRFSRILLRPPTLALGFLAAIFSPFLHGYALIQTQKDVKEAWKAQYVAEADSQQGLPDSWKFRQGGGTAEWMYFPPSAQQQLHMKRRILADIVHLQDELQSALYDGAGAGSDVVTTIASIYELFGLVNGPSSEPVELRNAFKATCAQLKPNEVEARVLRTLYGALRQSAPRRRIDDAYWRVRYQPDVHDLY